jgi:hypothetical protein
MFVLHPYTIFGKPGLIVTVMFAFYGVCCGLTKDYAKTFLIPAVMLVSIAFFGVGSSIVNGIMQINHLGVMVTFFIILLMAFGLSSVIVKNGITKNQLLTIILFCYVINSIVIVLEVNFPAFRSFIEGYLVPISNSSINYSEGFKLRGVASSGGAGLSMGTPVSLVLAIYLYDRQVLPTYMFCVVVCLLLFGVLVIGRTGLVLCSIPVFSYIVLLVSRANFSRLISMATISFLLLPFVYALTVEYFSEIFNEGFLQYAVGFMLDGSDGFRDEGTVAVIIQHLTALPTEFPQIITGYGFYGGSDFYPWTDSGFARTFLSVGLLGGGIFYLIVYRIYFSGFKKNKFLIGNLILLLTLAEIKEPMLFSGLSSRMFILILVFCWLDDHPPRKWKSIRSN